MNSSVSRAGISVFGEPNLSNVARIDHDVIPFTRACMRNGLCVDREHFWELSEYLESEIKELAYKITSYVPQEALDAFQSESQSIDDFNPDSPDQIAALLFRHLRVGTGIELTTTASGNRISTGKKQLERLKEEHPVIPLILQRREYTKLQNTYAKTIPNLAVYVPSIDRWKIYYNIGLTFTSTGRMTCSRLHQIPIRTELGRLIRQGFIPEPGCKFISADFSQLELRVLAHCAHERTMMEIFRDPKGDIHQKTQDGLNMPDTLDKIQKRLASKRTSFGIVYGTTDLGLWLTLQSDGVPCTREQCAEFQKNFFETYYDVLPFIQKQHYRARRYGFNWNMFGRVSPTPEFRSVHKRIVREGERRIQNWSIQSPSADIFKIAAANVNDFCLEVEKGLLGDPKHLKCRLPIHDQCLLTVSEEVADECSDAIADVMSSAVRLDVPLNTESEIQDRWTH